MTHASRNTIGETTVISGVLRTREDLEIRGHVDGHIDCKGRVTVHPNAVIRGPIRADEVVVRGFVHGDISSTGDAQIAASGFVRGDVYCDDLHIEPGGTLRGTHRGRAPQLSSDSEVERPQVLRRPRSNDLSAIKSSRSSLCGEFQARPRTPRSPGA